MRENAPIQAAIDALEILQFLVAVHRICDADLVEKLVDVKKCVGQRRFLNISPA